MRYLLMTSLLFIAAHSNAADNIDDWYQVELIVFKQLRPTSTDEVWSDQRNPYPADMKAIVAANADGIRPHLLGQLQQLAEENAIKVSGEVLNVESGFLFEDRATSRVNRVATENLWGNRLQDNNSVDGEIIIDEDVIATLFDPNAPQPFRALPEDSMSMTAVARSLRRSTGYRVLMHQAWAQPLDATPTPILIQAGDQYHNQFEVDGSISLSRSRFLHVQTDLWFSRFEPVVDFFESATGEIDPTWRREYKSLIEAGTSRRNYQAVVSAPMRHSRRMRSETIHYIDQPYFGLIVHIKEYTHHLQSEDALAGAAR